MQSVCRWSDILVLAPDLASAGAAASLIFLITFAVAHCLCVLMRQRSKVKPPQTPLFPAVPVLGGLACLTLAISRSGGPLCWNNCNGLAEYRWLLFLTLFARRARLRDVSSMAANPELLRPLGIVQQTLVTEQYSRWYQRLPSSAVADDCCCAGILGSRCQTVLRELIRVSSRLDIPVRLSRVWYTIPCQRSRVASCIGVNLCFWG